ncbi:MAG: phosphoribosylamine--glycine ligase [Actinomycetota bacterium]
MRILLIGSGGREHALAWSLSRSDSVSKIIAAPGNPGIGQLAECVAVKADDPDAVASLADQHSVDLVIVGPEAPLVAGVADAVRAKGIAVFGPSAAAAELEGSKTFAKEVMARAGVPTAASVTCTSLDEALKALADRGAPIVVKADGLAAGKGVTVAMDTATAEAAIRACMEDDAFGKAGSRVVLEDLLVGEEASLFCISDGARLFPLVGAQDFKRAHDGDQGPNTGGMGAYSPVPHLAEGIESAVERICQPVIDQMRNDGTPFIGLLYAGLMIDGDGEPSTVEFNCRFGDPETEVVLPRIEGDLGKVLLSAANGRLDASGLRASDRACVTVVLASGGYPGTYETGKPITGIEDAEALGDVIVFHAGTKGADDGTLVTAGGRVLAVSALGNSVADARAKAYEAADLIRFEGKMNRTDIASGR